MYAELKQTLNSCQMNATPQRLAILEYFRENRNHPDVDTVYVDLQNRIAGMSKTSIYRIVEEFCRHGLIKPFSTDGTRRRYDGNTEEHHHLICTACGSVNDLYLGDDQGVALKTRQKDGFKIQNASYTFYGICRECQQKD